jgi:hypothetical protein
MDVLILRLIHIGAGAFWVGAVFTLFLFVQPTAMALGPEGQRFSVQLTRNARLPTIILGSAVVAVAAGIILLWRMTNGLDLDVIGRHPALGFTVGGVAAILTLALGGLYVYPRTMRLVGIASSLMAQGRPPDADEMRTLGQLRDQTRAAGWWVLAGLTIAVVAMATARYWGVLF